MVHWTGSEINLDIYGIIPSEFVKSGISVAVGHKAYVILASVSLPGF